jgi:hypothetical protein
MAGDERDEMSALDAAPGLARLAATAWLRTAEWTAGSALRMGRRLAQAATSGESAGRLLDEARTELLDSARRTLGVTDLERLFGSAAVRSVRTDGAAPEPPAEPLRDRGAQLLARSAEVSGEEEDEGHPAFAAILSSLAPDEARILRLLFSEGPQAVVDVRTWRPLGIGSRVVAPGLSMIGQNAGCLRPERVPAYLSNLFRLGLTWFSREPVHEITAYQVLEAQPEVSAAMKEAGRASTVRRSIRLTPFGEQFCRAVLPRDTAEIEALDVR